DFFTALDDKTLPKEGGVFFVKGGSRNIFHVKPADPDAAVQKKFLGDDDHPGNSNWRTSEPCQPRRSTGSRRVRIGARAQSLLRGMIRRATTITCRRRFARRGRTVRRSATGRAFR